MPVLHLWLQLQWSLRDSTRSDLNRFPAMNRTYTRQLRDVATRIAAQHALPLRRGVNRCVKPASNGALAHASSSSLPSTRMASTARRTTWTARAACASATATTAPATWSASPGIPARTRATPSPSPTARTWRPGASGSSQIDPNNPVPTEKQAKGKRYIGKSYLMIKDFVPGRGNDD